MTRLFARTRSPEEASLVAAAGFDGTLIPDGGGYALEGLSGSTGPLACFADSLPDGAALDAAAEAGAAGLVLDSAGRLLDRFDPAALESVRLQCRERGLLCGFAGGLEEADLPRLLACDPDFLVLGRALRVGGRPDAPLDPEALRLLRDLVPGERGSQVAPPAALDLPPPGPHRDRIFLRDFVLPIEIGAYQSEHGRRQKVRFSVEADLAPRGRPARDMRDVVSYDLFADAIRALTANRHIAMAETLAEEIAARVLAHPRILVVRVNVEKLEVGPGVVGVAIERAKQPA